MNRYEAYKDSGIEWIKEIPSSWNAVGLKRISNTNTGITFTKSDLVEEGRPVVSYGQIHAKYNTGTSLSPELIRYIPDNLTEGRGNTIVNQNGFIFADTSEDLEGCGNCVFVNEDTSIYAGYHTIKMTLDNPEYGKYLSYLFKTDCWRSQIRSKVNGVKLFSITQTILNSCSVVLPPIQEQKAIADYLDDKCSKIDTLIADKKKQLEDLKTYKNSLISETVIKGINNANQISKSIPLKYLVSCNESVLSEQVDSNFEINYVEISDVDPDVGIKIYTRYKFSEAPSRARRITQKGDVIISTVRTYLKAIARVNEDNLIASTGFAVLKPIDIDGDFLYYYCKSTPFIEEIISRSEGVSYPAINANDLLAIKVIVPLISEQKAIANYLDDKCSKIDSLASEIKIEIEDLKDYKSSIISEAVTGKIKVC